MHHQRFISSWNMKYNSYLYLMRKWIFLPLLIQHSILIRVKFNFLKVFEQYLFSEGHNTKLRQNSFCKVTPASCTTLTFQDFPLRTFHWPLRTDCSPWLMRKTYLRMVNECMVSPYNVCTCLWANERQMH